MTSNSLQTIILLPYYQKLKPFMDTRKEAMALNSGFYCHNDQRNRKVQPRVLMSWIIILCRLGWNDRTNLLIFDCECDNTCNLTPTLCIILFKKKSHCLINRDRSLSADCISSNTWIPIPHHTLSPLLILSDKTFKAYITLSCRGAFAVLSLTRFTCFCTE